MASEARITVGFFLKKDNLHFNHRTRQFNVDVSVARGPTPGLIIVPTSGIDVDLSQLTVPGLCLISNIDEEHTFSYGIFNGVDYYPLGEVWPGEVWPLRLAQDIGEEYAGPGTGTTGAGTNTLRLMAHVQPSRAVVEAFER